MPCHETPACINNVYFPLLFRLTNYWKRFWTMLLRFCLSWCVLYARLGLHIIFCWFGETSFIIFFCFLLEAQKTRAVKSRLVIVFHLIGWETDASCLIGWETDASCLDQSAVKHHQRKPGLLSTFYWKLSLTFYSMHILHTALYTFSKMLTKRICLSIKNFFRLWSLPLFSWP